MAACYFACTLLVTSVDFSFSQHHTTSWLKPSSDAKGFMCEGS